MSSERRSRANRQNARASTGPRTAAGKARSSRNARTHGLNTPPDPALIARMYWTISESDGWDPNIGPGDIQDREGWALAMAEAQVARVQAEISHRLAAYVDDVLAPDFADETMLELEILYKCVPEGFPEREARALRRWIRGIDARHRGLRRDLKVLDRYLREAEAQRRKARKRWIAVKFEKSRNEPNNTLKLWNLANLS